MCPRNPRPKHRNPRLWMQAYYYNPKLFERGFLLVILIWVLWALSLNWS